MLLRDGRIAAIDPGAAAPPGAIDCAGDLVMPGLFELHTDNPERHIQPRPKVDRRHASAILAHDGALAATGITTAFDARRVGQVISGSDTDDGEYGRALADETLALRDAGAVQISQLLHLRAEVCSGTLVEQLDTFGPADRIGIVSLMDHAPGQRQLRDVNLLRKRVIGKHGLGEAGSIDHVAHLQAPAGRVRAPPFAAPARPGGPPGLSRRDGGIPRPHDADRPADRDRGGPRPRRARRPSRAGAARALRHRRALPFRRRRGGDVPPARPRAAWRVSPPPARRPAFAQIVRR